MKKHINFTMKIITIVFFVILSINSFSQTKPTLYPKLESGKYGYYNSSKTLVIPSQFDNALAFNQGLAAVKKAGKWGYINESGTLIIDYLYDDAWFFTEGLAPVSKSKKWGYIDKEGKTVIDFKYDDAGDFSDGIAWVKASGKVSFIDKTGKTVVGSTYSSATSFSEGLAGVSQDKLWGYIDKDGNTKIKFQYDDAMPFEDGLAAVKQGSYWGYIDIYAKKMVDFTYSTLKDDYQDITFAWNYAKNSYDAISENSNFYKEHLTKAVALIRKKGSYFYQSELELLAKYYEALGDNDGVSWAKSELRANKKNSRSKSTSMDLSVAVAPVKLGMYKFYRQVPLYSELRLGLVGTALRYCSYDDHMERYRFKKINEQFKNDTMIYSGSDVSLFLLFYLKEYIESASVGHGYSGMNFGFEYRNSNYKIKQMQVTATDYYGYNTTSVLVSPTYKVQEVSFVLNFTYSKDFIYFSMGYSIGVGHRIRDGINYNNFDFTETLFDEGSKSVWTMPLRVQCRLGINIL